jgi:hypothetical protein
MDSKSTRPARGVQQSDVFAAADQVLARGDRPTVEKVRQELGTGSPNTVGPMLDAWFAGLGHRLGLGQQVQHDDDELAGLRRAHLDVFDELVRFTRVAAEDAAQAQLAAQQAAVVQRDRELGEQALALNEREEAFGKLEVALRAALTEAHANLANAARRESFLEQEIKQYGDLHAQLAAKITELENKVDAANQRHRIQIDEAEAMLSKARDDYQEAVAKSGKEYESRLRALSTQLDAAKAAESAALRAASEAAVAARSDVELAQNRADKERNKADEAKAAAATAQVQAAHAMGQLVAEKARCAALELQLRKRQKKLP